LLPKIAPGEIEIALDIDHAAVKLLLADGAIIDDGDLRRHRPPPRKGPDGHPCPGRPPDQARRRDAQR